MEEILQLRSRSFVIESSIAHFLQVSTWPVRPKYTYGSNHEREHKFQRTRIYQCSMCFDKWIDIFREPDNGRFGRRITRIQNFQVIFVFHHFSVQFTWQWTSLLFNFLQSPASSSFVEQVVVKSECLRFSNAIIEHPVRFSSGGTQLRVALRRDYVSNVVASNDIYSYSLCLNLGGHFFRQVSIERVLK